MQNDLYGLDSLLKAFFHQKTLALEKAGLPPERIPKWDMERSAELYGVALGKMAQILMQWQADPGIVMEACFYYARSKKHMDGPQMNMLGSSKYLLQALAYHLELPKDAVADMISKESCLRRIEQEALKQEQAIRRYLILSFGNDDRDLLLRPQVVMALVMWHSVPPLFLFLYNTNATRLAFLILPQVMESIRTDAVLSTWSEKCGWTYENMAKYYNLIKKKYDEN